MSENSTSQFDSFEKAMKEGAADLLQSVESGKFAEAMQTIQELSEARHKSFYNEVGHLTRSLHDAIRDFQIDTVDQIVTKDEAASKITDATDRLNYVIEMTSRAANVTMDMIDSSVPVAGNLQEQARDLRKDWGRLIQRDLTPTEFRDLYKRMDTFLKDTDENATLLHSNLNSILLEQGYQDLTGQVITKVTDLIRDVEEKLVHLVAVAGRVDSISGIEHEEKRKAEEANDDRGHGPAINSENPEVLSNQDEVDDLLSSLGF
ncbi:protein phosphatase CheZ [Marinomonas agarivorans]|nr:protein phosphatase CheZ [Marinomonas agarivorans]